MQMYKCAAHNFLKLRSGKGRGPDINPDGERCRGEVSWPPDGERKADLEPCGSTSGEAKEGCGERERRTGIVRRGERKRQCPGGTWTLSRSFFIHPNQVCH